MVLLKALDGVRSSMLFTYKTDLPVEERRKKRRTDVDDAYEYRL